MNKGQNVNLFLNTPFLHERHVLTPNDQPWLFWKLQNFPHNRFDVQVVLAKAVELSIRTGGR